MLKWVPTYCVRLWTTLAILLTVCVWCQVFCDFFVFRYHYGALWVATYRDGVCITYVANDDLSNNWTRSLKFAHSDNDVFPIRYRGYNGGGDGGLGATMSDGHLRWYGLGVWGVSSEPFQHQFPSCWPPGSQISLWDVNVPYLGLIGLVLAGIVVAGVRQRRGFPPGYCFRCGFDIRASGDRCSECGDVIDPSQRVGANRQSDRPGESLWTLLRKRVRPSNLFLIVFAAKSVLIAAVFLFGPEDWDSNPRRWMTWPLFSVPLNYSVFAGPPPGLKAALIYIGGNIANTGILVYISRKFVEATRVVSRRARSSGGADGPADRELKGKSTGGHY
jgi:hypothetical protein